MKLNRGFTLIELVTVIILIGILAVAVLPKFDGTSSYEAHTHRAQLIAALRLTQQRAMQQTNTTDGYCHQIVFDNDPNISRYGVPDRTKCATTTFASGWSPDATGHEVDTRYDITFSVSFVGDAIISFDWMGRPLGGCSSGCTIDVESAVENGANALKIKIEAEGYIHGI
ncbi:type II secretion system protein [Colwellia sp. TT2012]|uniref:type II secretion system protein n=1 Tax=Colwellia sp. TT2012 TaxID=1720342 RepID=UPI00070D87CB|nr:type II secretion system protein [Colwellia sp. TT2012]